MEIIANAVQTVEDNQNVLFTDTVIGGSYSIIHRDGSGLVTLRGLTNTQCRARFRVSFGANVALPTGSEIVPISLALTIDGEPVAATTMIYTPVATAEYGNIFSSVFLDVPRSCCSRVSVTNITDVPVDVQNANLIVERVA